MKYVCTQCGEQLRVDRDIDEDDVVQRAIAGHRAADCPGVFPEE